MNKLSTLFKFKILTVIITILSIGDNKSIYSIGNNSSNSSSDEYSNIRYSTAFDQEEIYKKYKQLLEKLDCAQNVFSAQSKDTATGQEKTQAYDNQNKLASNQSTATLSIDLKKFEQECLEKLNKARFMTLAEPGIYDLLYTILFIGCAITTNKICSYIAKTKEKDAESSAIVKNKTTEKDSMGGSFAVFSSVTNVFMSLPRLIQIGYQLKFRPDNFMANLEEYYAKNKCYIPNLLWEKIEEAFVQARQNQYAREKNINFLRIALSFTMHKPKPEIQFKNNMSVDEVKDELNQRIDNFFKDYKKDNNFQSLWYIKINVSKFIDSLINKNFQTSAPRYVYMYGLGGIGKTYFVQTLAQWIDELIPNSVNFENLIIASSAELEGNDQKPGAFLKVLQNQLTQQKNGSVVMVDEATWINDFGMISSAKRIFNGEQSKLSTEYFGTDMHGQAVILDIPPMLIFLASNDEIKDGAVASRFDIVNYPTPSKFALISHAIKTAKNSIALAREKCKIDENLIATFVENLELKNQNFRHVAGNVETLLLTQTQN